MVASDIPVLPEYLTGHETAVLTRVGDPQSLADGLREVVPDAALRAPLIEGGRSLVPESSWGRAAHEHQMLHGETGAEPNEVHAAVPVLVAEGALAFDIAGTSFELGPAQPQSLRSKSHKVI